MRAIHGFIADTFMLLALGAREVTHWLYESSMFFRYHSGECGCKDADCASQKARS